MLVKGENLLMGNPSNTAPKAPYLEEEFEVFIEHIGNENIDNWTIFARALNVDRTTVGRWKKHPRARMAMLKAMRETINGMKNAGGSDWRMWREKAKMLGIDDVSKVELSGSIDSVMRRLETDYDKLSDELERETTERQSMENESPVQDQEQAGESDGVQTESDPDPAPDPAPEPPVQPDPQS
jgi:hypothetical protein